MKRKLKCIGLLFCVSFLVMNPSIGMEGEPRPSKKKVRIHGLGIAGLMSALGLVKDGHVVYLHDKRKKSELFERKNFYVNLKENIEDLFIQWNLLEEFQQYPGIDRIQEHIISQIPGDQKASRYCASIATLQLFLYEQLEKEEYKDQVFLIEGSQNYEEIKFDPTVDFQIWAAGARSLPCPITREIEPKDGSLEIWKLETIPNSSFASHPEKPYTWIHTDREKDINYIYHFSDKIVSIGSRLDTNKERYDGTNPSQLKIRHTYARNYFDKERKILFIGDCVVASTPRMGMGASLAMSKYPMAVLQFTRNLGRKTEQENWEDYARAIKECIYDWLVVGNRKFHLGLDEGEMDILQ